MSATMQNQSLRSTIPQAAFDENYESLSSYNEPIQTRSKTKMKNSTNSMYAPFGKRKAQGNANGNISGQADLDDDDAAKLELQRQEQIAPLETIDTKNYMHRLSKRQRPTLYRQDLETPESDDNYNDSDGEDDNNSNRDSNRDKSTTIKKRKLRTNNVSSEIENNNDNNNKKKHSNSGNSTSGSIQGSRSEMETTKDQQQTDLVSPVSPVPNYLINEATYTKLLGNKVNDKEKDQESIEVEKPKNNDFSYHGPQRFTSDDDKPQSSANSMERHSDTQSSHTDTCKSGDNSLNLDMKKATVDEHVQSIGFLKRVASYIFG